jgi:Tol biopolymer transport system component
VARAVSLFLVALGLGALAGPAGAAFPGRNGLIAYTVECCTGSDSTDYSTQLVTPDGRRGRLVEGSDRVSFSPDGTRLVWGDAFGYGLHVLRLDSRRFARRISRAEAFDADWSPSGRSIVSVHSSGLWIRTRGRGRRLVAGREPAWSVRNEIAFVTARGIEVIRPDGRNRRTLVAPPAGEPDWSPDGRRVAYVAAGRIWTVRADGTGRRRLQRGYSPSFSPDGRKIVYMGPGRLVRIMDAKGRRSHRLPFRGNFHNEEDTFSRPDWQPLPPLH